MGHSEQVLRIRPRHWRRLCGFQLRHGQAQLQRKVAVKRALDLHHCGRVVSEHSQRFQIVSLGPSQAQDSSKVFEIEIVLPDKELKRRTCQGALTNFLHEWMEIDRLPDRVRLLAYLPMELWHTHRPPPPRGADRRHSRRAIVAYLWLPP